MNRMFKSAVAGMVCLGIFGGAAQADAAETTLLFDLLVGNVQPIGTGPYASLKIADTGTNQVTLTLTNNTAPSTGQFISRLYLNLASIAGVNFATTSTRVMDYSFGTVNNAGHRFNAEVDFAMSASSGLRLTGGQSASFVLSGTGLNATNLLSLNSSGFVAMLQLQGIGPRDDSTKLAAVPEPSTMAALALGTLLFARRKRKSA